MVTWMAWPRFRMAIFQNRWFSLQGEYRVEVLGFFPGWFSLYVHDDVFVGG